MLSIICIINFEQLETKDVVWHGIILSYKHQSVKKDNTCLAFISNWINRTKRKPSNNKTYWLNSATFLCRSQPRPWISNVMCSGLFCVRWVHPRVDRFPSLFKLSFHKTFLLFDRWMDITLNGQNLIKRIWSLKKKSASKVH